VDPGAGNTGRETEPGLVVYRFGADLFYANVDRFTDEVRALVERAPEPVRWFIVDASAITDVDYSAARAIRELIDEQARQKVRMIFARVSPYLRSDMERHRLTAAIGETWIFTTLHEAVATVRGSMLAARAEEWLGRKCYGQSHPDRTCLKLRLDPSTGVNLDRLSALWARAVLLLFPSPVRVNGRLVLVGGSVKIPKHGKKMRTVKLLHQQSESNCHLAVNCKNAPVSPQLGI
jgi:STAS domain